jgi:hypothetical protein
VPVTPNLEQYKQSIYNFDLLAIDLAAIPIWNTRQTDGVKKDVSGQL